MSNEGQRFRSRMSNGRPAVGFDDGAEIFDTEADADRAAWLLHQAFSLADHRDAQQLRERVRVLEEAVMYLLYHPAGTRFNEFLALSSPVATEGEGA